MVLAAIPGSSAARYQGIERYLGVIDSVQVSGCHGRVLNPERRKMSTTIDASRALTANSASKSHIYVAQWPVVLVGALIGLMGLILLVGGAYLAALGGSWYYVLAGAMFLAAGYLMIRGRIGGLYIYVGAFAFTFVWTVWEVGLSGWELIPRLVGPFVFLLLAIMVAPKLDATSGRLARKQ